MVDVQSRSSESVSDIRQRAFRKARKIVDAFTMN